VVQPDHGTYLMPRDDRTCSPEVIPMCVQAAGHSTRRTKLSVANGPGGSGDHRGELPSELNDLLQVFLLRQR